MDSAVAAKGRQDSTALISKRSETVRQKIPYYRVDHWTLRRIAPILSWVSPGEVYLSRLGWVSNHLRMYAHLASIWLGRAPMSCDESGTRTSTVSIFRSFSAW